MPSFFLAELPSYGLETLGHAVMILMIVTLVAFFLAMGGLLWFGRWAAIKRGSLSPYSKQPLILGSDVAFSAVREVEAFLQSLPQKGANPPFSLYQAAICRQTGRIFPDCINFFGYAKIDRHFLKKRFPGNWVSWGSLSSSQQAVIRAAHSSLDLFQTELSSSFPYPHQIEALYALTKPGPLYVDWDTKTLLGWQCVPNTALEVLVVQLPEYNPYLDS